EAQNRNSLLGTKCLVSLDAVPHRAIGLSVIGDDHRDRETAPGERPREQGLLKLRSAGAESSVFGGKQAEVLQSHEADAWHVLHSGCHWVRRRRWRALSFAL